MRVVLELAGIRNAFGKQLGSGNPLNNARATIEGLRAQRTVQQVAEERGLTVAELMGFKPSGMPPAPVLLCRETLSGKTSAVCTCCLLYSLQHAQQWQQIAGGAGVAPGQACVWDPCVAVIAGRACAACACCPLTFPADMYHQYSITALPSGLKQAKRSPSSMHVCHCSLTPICSPCADMSSDTQVKQAAINQDALDEQAASVIAPVTA